MLIKVSVPFILAAAAFAVSVPTLDRRDITANLGCPPAQGGQVQGSDVSKSGVVVVRDLAQGLVGYLAAPKGNEQAFSFTEDRASALTANIIPLKDGQDNSGGGKYYSVRIGLPGSQSFIGATTVAIPSLNGAYPSGAPPAAGGSPPSGGVPPAVGLPPVPPSGEAPPAGGLPPVPPTGGIPPSVGKPAVGDVGSGLVRTVTMAVVNAADSAAKTAFSVLKDTDGEAWNLSFIYDNESRQILSQKQIGDAQPQITNWKFDDGHFCLFDQNSFQGDASGSVNFFFVSN